MRAAAENLVPVTLELGGKSPVIIGESAKLQIACERIVWGKFMNAGQTCVAPDYIFVSKQIFADFIEKLKETIVRFYGENIRNNPDYGKIVNARHFKRLTGMLEQDKSFIAFGGESDEEARFIGPTVLCPANTEIAACMKEEIFGPLLPVFPYESMEEVLSFIDVRMNNNNFDVTYKLTLGLAEECKLFGESMFGQEELSQSGCELVSHRWVRCEGKKNAVNVYNSGTYGFSFKRGVLSMNLLRSAAYSAHPLTGRDLLFEDRVIERIDCGVRTFNFRIELCEAENSLAKALNGAELFNSPPYAENFWPDGTRDNISNSLLELDNKKVELCSFRKTDNGYCMRLYNGSDAEASVKVVCKVLKIEKSLHLQPFTFGTYILRENKIEVTDPAFCKTEESV